MASSTCALRLVTRAPVISTPSSLLLRRTLTTSRPLLDSRAPPKNVRGASEALSKIFNFQGAASSRSQPSSPASRIFGDNSSRSSVFRNTAPTPAMDEALPMMGPSAGRSVYVTRDLPSAMMQLNATLRQNNVKHMVRAAREHVRPGLKRKKLKQQRWRKRFFGGFKRMIRVAMKMKSMGM